MTAPQLSYAGVDILETLEGATNYNSLLLGLIRESSQGRSRMLDFGAGTGTFAKLLRTKGIEVVCVEPDMHLAERLIRDGFLTFSDLNDVPDGTFEFVFTLNVLEHVEDDWASTIAVIAEQTWSDWLGRLGSVFVKPDIWTHWVSLLLSVLRFLATKTATLARERSVFTIDAWCR